MPINIVPSVVSCLIFFSHVLAYCDPTPTVNDSTTSTKISYPIPSNATLHPVEKLILDNNTSVSSSNKSYMLCVLNIQAMSAKCKCQYVHQVV